MVLDHLPELTPPRKPAAHRACDADLQLLGHRPQVFAKVSGIVRNVGGCVPLDLDFYLDRLDHIWGTFGQDRLLYGSDQPNSNQWAEYRNVSGWPTNSFQRKIRRTVEKFFWKSSLKTYA